MLTGADIAPGDVILGLASSGVHSNGFSLVRRIIDRALGPRRALPRPGDLGEALLEPTRIYVRSLLPLVQERRIKGLAHITGGGLLENIPRVLPDGCHAIVDTARWPCRRSSPCSRRAAASRPRKWRALSTAASAWRRLLLPSDADDVTAALEGAGETVVEIGRIEEGQRGCTVRGRGGSWDSAEDWSATHNA